MQGCATQLVDSTSSHTEPIATMTNKQTLIDELNKTIALANHEIEQKNWQEANIHLKNALNTLGYRYLKPVMEDDTGMKLIVADDFERKGLLEKSARLRLKMLQERFDLFKTNP